MNENRLKQLEASRKWKAKNKEKVAEYQKKWRSNNKERIKEYMKDWRESNQDNIQEYNSRWKEENSDYFVDKHLKYKYGISIEKYTEMLKKQDFKCAICKVHESEAVRKKLFVDHCHKSNEIRSLLCLNCNTAIGHAKEDTTILQSMIDYLKDFNAGY
jgi:cAMP phosphodiesterase